MKSFNLVTCLLTALTASAAAETKPNIIFLLADDLGYGDLRCYGHPYARTPALDKLASEGTMFKNFHVTGVTCCPSRTGFMTGKFPASFRAYPAQHGFGARVTVTELLHEAGYRTGHFGKWHIGPDAKPGVYGIDVVRTQKQPELDGDGARGRDARIYDDAIEFIEANKDVPFYINVWDHIPHFPVNPPQAYADKFNDLTVQESDFASSERMREKFASLKKAGGDVSEHMRNYLAELLSLDDCIARLLDRLDKLGLREKTIVVFSSDQGAAPLRLADQLGKKTRGTEYRLNMLGYGGPFRGGKHNMYEGGVRVPFIIRWPGHVAAGRVEEKSLVSGIDWLPTLCTLTGVKLPSLDLDGEDVSDIWLGKSRERGKPLFWKTSTARSEIAILDGTWKLLTPGGRRRGPDEIELFDLANDPGERNNVAAKRPEVVKTLSAKIAAWNATLPKRYLKGDANDGDL